MDEGCRARVPADIEQGDRIIGNFTGRQVAILAVTTAGLWLVYLATRAFVPLTVFAAGAAPIAVVAFVLALGRRDGLPLDAFVFAAIRQHRRPRRLVTAPEGVQPLPSWVDGSVGGGRVAGCGGGPLPSPLKLPAHAVKPDGVIGLGPDGAAVIVACSTVNFSLATPDEQDATIGAFAAVLHALSMPAHVLVRAERVSLAPFITRLAEAAPGLPDPELENAAREHAAFLTGLAARRDLLYRTVLLVLRDPRGGRLAVMRAADEAVRALAACGVTARIADGPAAAALLAGACEPGDQPSSTGQSAVRPLGEGGV